MSIEARPAARRSWTVPLVAAVAVHGLLGMMPMSMTESEPQEEAPLRVVMKLPPPPEPEPEPQPEPVTPPPPKVRPKKKKIIEPPPEVPVPVPQPVAKPDPVKEEPPPEPTPAPPPVAPAPKKVVRIDLRGLRTGIMSRVDTKKRYPRAARRLGLEGVAVVMVAVSKDGSLAKDPTLRRSTGHDILDREAIRMVRAAAPFTPLPNEFPKSYATFPVPVRFQLQDS